MLRRHLHESQTAKTGDSGSVTFHKREASDHWCNSLRSSFAVVPLTVATSASTLRASTAVSRRGARLWLSGSICGLLGQLRLGLILAPACKHVSGAGGGAGRDIVLGCPLGCVSALSWWRVSEDRWVQPSSLCSCIFSYEQVVGSGLSTCEIFCHLACCLGFCCR